MELQSISIKPLLEKQIAILGYGSQGRAQALCLRDSDLRVIIGVRQGGPSEKLAREDGFDIVDFRIAAEVADIIMFLLPDQVIPAVYAETASIIAQRLPVIGFAHGFVVTYNWIEKIDRVRKFLVSPKGAGAILRQRFVEGIGLPAAYAVEPTSDIELRQIATAYAKAIGCASTVLLETSFREETESDLFGEQVVLCGGILELMRVAFDTLVERGISAEMAFFECCYEARLITQLWTRFGPEQITRQISPTAFFGGLTRGKRLVTEETKKEIEKIFDEIRSGRFAEQWRQEVGQSMPLSEKERRTIARSKLNETYAALKDPLSLAEGR